MSQVQKYDKTIFELINSVKAASVIEDESRERRNKIVTYIIGKLEQLMLDVRKDMENLEKLKVEKIHSVRVLQVDSRNRNDEYPDSLTF